jgi:hypothetical protein
VIGGGVTGRQIISEKRQMQVDCSDARYELKIGDRVKRSLIRHYHAFIIKQVQSRGFDAEDPKLFNQDNA